MADEQEKTEAPSQHKIQKARQEGNVAKSPEVSGVILMLVGLMALFVIFPFWVKSIRGIYIYMITFPKQDITISDVVSIFWSLISVAGIMILPVFGFLLFAGIIGNTMQFGFLLTIKAIKPKLSKINPISGIKNVFSIKKLIDGGMITLKVLIALIVGGIIIIGFLHEIEGVAHLSMMNQILWWRNKCLILIGAMIGVFSVMAFADYLLKRRQYIKSLRMSKQEVKDELIQHEGNPEVKAKMRQIMRKNAMSRMMSAIPSAQVVVTNPTHYAVALAFERGKHEAPMVVAKGIDHLAIRIKDIARQNDIEIIESPKLARSLYKEVDLNQEIPGMLFEAVVQVFKEVERLRKIKGKKSILDSN
ncbi:flagellar biosynthesis protein FlhB [Helicobacter fennelliae]|uniref:Flagellar biosynthetic protein FlhB n=2 Tax=Helicobacter fennelliae TaxID=215 RepID=T1DWA0_9HELI|nr:flagellar biosynthesis protein FlhB [Helicobacter fennelliae]GAD19257.1 flagellar biosynthesis protein FlhB [Helicobacter fennelliae MRY12-0050]SQB99037.1 flagellar biosynthetic protein [Helicobacter fennelliae]STP08318.1 flagellar biosynthetic protein [Helicobacter fennelliae]STQ84731.1 flagellar biosynthetic protein [Helicobacter fennelliae]